MSDDNKKRNSELFLGIVGVATLIVAIIGASFSYFVASAGSGDAAIDLTAYQFNASLGLVPLFITDAEMIPIDADAEVGVANAEAPYNTNLMYALNVAKKCTDDHGLRVCAVYEITITNNSSEPITLEGSIVTDVNTGGENDAGFKNLQYRKVTKVDVNEYDIDTTDVPLGTSAGDTADIEDVTVAGNSSEKVYVLIYLKEKGLSTDSQNDEMGATFQGRFVFTSSTLSDNKLTGTFAIGG